METNNREDRLKKLRAAKEKLTHREVLPTIRKEDLGLSTALSKMNSLQASTNSESLTSRIENVSTSLSALREAKAVLLKNAKNKTEVVFIIDKSGSVSGTEPEVISGINSIICKERKKERNDIVTTILFNHNMEIIHDRLSLDDIRSFNYSAGGGTALYDTLVSQINRIKDKQQSDSDKPKNTIVVISTDGEDLNSKKCDSSDARNIIEERTNAGWQFIFLGANFDVVEEAERLGIKASNAAEYSTLRLSDNFKAIEKALDDVYETGEVTEEWSKPITEHNALSSGDNKTYTKKLLGDK